MQFDLRTIVIVVVIILFVLSVNLTLFGLMRGNKNVQAEADKWALAVGGGRQAQAKHDADVAALHSAVEALKQAPPPADTPPHD